MKKKEVQKLCHGLYRIYWKDNAGDSMAAVGSLNDGTRWYAPTNWTAMYDNGIACTDWKKVDRVELIQY